MDKDNVMNGETAMDYRQELEKEVQNVAHLEVLLEEEKHKRMDAESEAFRYRNAFELLIRTLMK